MKCRQCHNKITNEDWKHCPHCGESLKDEKIIRFVLRVFFRGKNKYLTASLFLILLSVGVFVFYKNHQTIEKKNQEIREVLDKEREISIDWTVKSKVLPITYFNGDYSLIDLDITSPTFATLEVLYSVEGLTDVEKKTIKIKPGSKKFHLKPKLKETGIMKLAQSQQAKVMLKIFIKKDNSAEEKIIEDSRTTFFYSINDIIWQDAKGSNENAIIRLVDKDHQKIKELVRSAADHMKDLGAEENAMVGAFGDKKEMERQLKAIFLAMKNDLQIKYVFAPFSYDNNVIQKIKNPIEVIETKSGLCIELSLLLAAALENIGLNPAIVLTSSHAYAGIEIGPRTNDFVFIETTALEKTPNEAMKMGMDNWERRTGYKLLRVSELRHDGYFPLSHYYH